VELLTTVKLAAGTPPNVTLVAPVKPDPLIVTEVPPAVGPNVGFTAEAVGGTATNAMSSKYTETAAAVDGAASNRISANAAVEGDEPAPLT
jgi:hypothetical protein